ncbi:SET domain-containing protein [Guyanagaster necrorhizus]|uniref:SET domain-containing protein n=1 Tax=Guyanagaster necrorhizus TaxID=856835 RepID=A0A9P7VXY9_9AGAR|nr:SET domain-containing protein [Guyanagaster necrorhizus MCA 3950]KAG7448795.1 SET domain-containing protein [Guyanagaster necrorhizus MCA 3950]
MNDPTIENPTSLVVHAAFREAWDAFYAWEQEYCRESIRNLAVQDIDEVNEDEWEIGQSARLGAEGFCIQQYQDGDTITSWLPVEVIEVTALFPECSPYESSPLASRSVFHGDDPDSMLFMPFADDPSFIEIPQDGDQLHHTYYTEFEWQTLDDPDIEIIVSAAAQKLINLNNMTFEEIDHTNVFPSEMQVMANLCRRRDLLPWLRTSFSLPGSGPRTREISFFCNNLNCLVSHCMVHWEYSPIPVKQMPKKKSIRLSDDNAEPCGPNCFLHGNLTFIEMHWTPEDIETLHIMLDHAPDMIPCELTTICRKPCQEIYKRRCVYIPDVLVDAIPRQRPPMRYRNLKIKDTDHHAFTPNIPCEHDGPCDAQSGCLCFKNNNHCVRSCQCAGHRKPCIRRRTGCDCSTRECRRSPCSCFMENKECDPELCHKGRARDLEDCTICRNMAIQRGRQKAVEVKESQWGLGLYLLEPAERDDFIIEYVGELIFEPSVDTRCDLARHRNRNYMFELNQTLTLDSTYLSNESRYMNHSKQSNCRSITKLVNGEHRIGIYANRRMQPGEELLFDYGDNFFQND